MQSRDIVIHGGNRDRPQASGYPPSCYHAEPIPGENRPFADRIATCLSDRTQVPDGR